MDLTQTLARYRYASPYRGADSSSRGEAFTFHGEMFSEALWEGAKSQKSHSEELASRRRNDLSSAPSAQDVRTEKQTVQWPRFRGPARANRCEPSNVPLKDGKVFPAPPTPAQVNAQVGA